MGLEAAASEQSEILRLKREAKVLMKRTPAEEAKIRRIMREINHTAEEEEPQPQAATGNKRRRKMVIKKTLVPREAIEFMILYPHKPLEGFPEEKLAIYSQEFRESYFRRKAIADNLLEQQRALIMQFRKKGYAEDYKEVEVTDDEDN
nr:unnamed protein product [Digitaria exilis]